MIQGMKVVILCGGLGTRLREETEYRPKPMVEVGGRPILWHIMKLYAHYGYKDFILCLGYKGEVIKEYFLNYHAMRNDFTVNLGSRTQIQFHGSHDEEDWKVTLADTGQETLTAERLYQVLRYVGDGPFMATYGDGVADIDMNALIGFHRAQGRLATLTGVRDASRFGVVETDGNGRVTGFKEKPQVQERINAGFLVFEPGVFRYLEGRREMLEKVLPDLAQDGELSIFSHDGFWHCMDTYRDYQKLNELWDQGRAPWTVWK
jgi:glucose-1-phosphate cytidylyltransferase